MPLISMLIPFLDAGKKSSPLIQLLGIVHKNDIQTTNSENRQTRNSGKNNVRFISVIIKHMIYYSYLQTFKQMSQYNYICNDYFQIPNPMLQNL